MHTNATGVFNCIVDTHKVDVVETVVECLIGLEAIWVQCPTVTVTP